MKSTKNTPKDSTILVGCDICKKKLAALAFVMATDKQTESQSSLQENREEKIFSGYAIYRSHDMSQ